MRNFRRQFVDRALNQTCTLQLPATYSSAQWGLGGIAADPLTVSLRCLSIPPRERIDREQGQLIITPQQLLLEDPAAQVTPACRIVFQGISYHIQQLTRSEDGRFAQVTLGKA